MLSLSQACTSAPADITSSTTQEVTTTELVASTLPPVATTSSTSSGPSQVIDVTVTKSECTLNPTPGPINPGDITLIAHNETEAEAGVHLWGQLGAGHTFEDFAAHIEEEIRLTDIGEDFIGPPGWFGNLIPGDPEEATMPAGETRTFTGIATAGTYGVVCARTLDDLGMRVVGYAGPIEISEVSAGPAARGYVAMTTLDENLGVMVFGGFTGPPPNGESLADSWLFAPTVGWTEVGSSPPVNGDTVAYDIQSGRVIMYSAFAKGFDSPSVIETWALDPVGEQWEQMSTKDVPTGMWAPHLAYDAQSDVTTLIGPPDPSPNPDSATWAYDYDTDTWTEMQPANPMPRRWFPAMAYDPGCDLVIVFGGFTATGDPFAETWGYDYDADAWIELTPIVSPSARGYSAMAYDPVSRRMILFGGQPYPESVNDTWAYDCSANSWTEVATDAAPSARGKHGMAFNPVDGTIVLFGGATILGSGPAWEALPTETWVFDPADNTWTSNP